MFADLWNLSIWTYLDIFGPPNDMIWYDMYVTWYVPICTPVHLCCLTGCPSINSSGPFEGRRGRRRGRRSKTSSDDSSRASRRGVWSREMVGYWEMYGNIRWYYQNIGNYMNVYDTIGLKICWDMIFRCWWYYMIWPVMWNHEDKKRLMLYI